MLSLSFFFICVSLTNFIRNYILDFDSSINDGAIAFIPIVIYFSLFLALYQFLIFKVYNDNQVGIKYLFFILIIPLLINIVVSILISWYWGFFSK